MESLDAAALRDGALVLVDSAPIIYTLEAHAKFAARFAPLFQRHADGEIVFAVTTVTIAEVLTGPLKAGEEALAKRYRAVLDVWAAVRRSVVIDGRIGLSSLNIVREAKSWFPVERPFL